MDLVKIDTAQCASQSWCKRQIDGRDLGKLHTLTTCGLKVHWTNTHSQSTEPLLWSWTG